MVLLGSGALAASTSVSRLLANREWPCPKLKLAILSTARTDEANSGQYALHDATDGLTVTRCARGSEMQGSECRDGRAQRHEGVRTQSRRLASQLPVGRRSECAGCRANYNVLRPARTLCDAGGKGR